MEDECVGKYVFCFLELTEMRLNALQKYGGEKVKKRKKVFLAISSTLNLMQ